MKSKTSKTWQLLIASLAGIVIFLVGREFFYPISTEELAKDLNLRMGCLAVYLCAWILCLALVEYHTTVQLYKYPIGTLILIIFIFIFAPNWVIPLSIATGIIVVLLVLEWTKPSTSWRAFFLVNKKNNNIKISYIFNY